MAALILCDRISFLITGISQNPVPDLGLNSIITIRSYYSVFGDIASMWNQVSRSSVFPGLHIVDQISSFDPREDSSMIRRRASELQEWSKRAIDDITRKAKDVRDFKFLIP